MTKRHHPKYKQSKFLPKAKTYEDYLRNAGYVKRHGEWVKGSQHSTENDDLGVRAKFSWSKGLYFKRKK